MKIDVRRVMADRIYDDKTPPSTRAFKNQRKMQIRAEKDFSSQQCSDDDECEASIPSETKFEKPITFFDYKEQEEQAMQQEWTND